VSEALRVLVVSGSSGGHLIHAEALLDALSEEGRESLLVLPKKNIFGIQNTSGYKTEYISVSSIGLKPTFRNLKAFFCLWKGACESAKILNEFKPGVVAGFGSIVSVPMVLLAKAKGIKVLIHEQNFLPGRATRFLARYADSIAVSFRETTGYLKGSKAKLLFTGNPLRKGLSVIEREEALNFFGLSKDKFTVLVCGGSQASSRLNSAFPSALAGIAGNSKVQVIHLSGKKELEAVEKKYKEIGVDARCFGFLDKMQYAYSAANLAVSRSGATTIAELGFFKLPAILIPYPYAYRHQHLNAGALEKAGCAMVVDDSELDKGRLGEELARLLGNRDEVSRMRGSFASLTQSDHGELLGDALLSLAKYRRVN